MQWLLLIICCTLSVHAEVGKGREYLFPFAKGGRLGVMLGSGEIVAPAEYDFPVHYDRHAGALYVAAVQANQDEWAAIVDQNVVLGQHATVYFDEGQCFPPTSPESCLVSRNELLGFVFKDGTIITPRYRAATLFEGGCAWVLDETGCHVIDREGKRISPSFNQVDDIGPALFRVKVNKTYGISTGCGDMIVKPEWEWVDCDDSQVFRVMKHGQWGLLDMQGTPLLPPSYDRMGEFHEEIAHVSFAGTSGYITNGGRTILLPPDIDGARRDFSDGLATVFKNGRAGCMDKTGQMVIRCEFDDVMAFRHGIAWFRSYGLFGLIDKMGKIVTPPRYIKPSEFGEGVAAVEKADGTWAVLHRDGTEISVAEAKTIRPFSSGMAVFEGEGERYGAVDREGRIAIKPRFKELKAFEQIPPRHAGTRQRLRVAIARSDYDYGLVDDDGRWLIEPRYTRIGPVESDGLRYAYRRDGMGRLSPSGEVVVPCHYSYLGRFRFGLALACRDAAVSLSGDIAAGTWEYINREDKVIRPEIDKACVSISIIQ